MTNLSPWHANSGVLTEPLHPELKRRAASMLADPELGNRVRIASGARTYAQQKRLYDLWRAGRYRVPVVANPDRVLSGGRKGSLHMVQPDGHAHAIDFDFAPHPDDWALLEKVAKRHGLRRTVPSEGWHYEVNPSHAGPAAPPPEVDWSGILRMVEQARTQTLQRGDSGFAVQVAQHRLGINADGIFGRKTEEAVRALQAWCGLPVNGIIDAAVWSLLLRER